MRESVPKRAAMLIVLSTKVVFAAIIARIAPCIVSGVGGKMLSAKLLSPASNERPVRNNSGSVGSIKMRITPVPFVPGMPQREAIQAPRRGHSVAYRSAAQLIVWCLAYLSRRCPSRLLAQQDAWQVLVHLWW